MREHIASTAARGTIAGGVGGGGGGLWAQAARAIRASSEQRAASGKERT
ncbi:MAG TPA: hypothetical protein VL284_20995 [Thermoanaerobaculia bacterium]|nr:hypothetical protein [Thermoanaerobaculia bacterium]